MLSFSSPTLLRPECFSPATIHFNRRSPRFNGRQSGRYAYVSAKWSWQDTPLTSPHFTMPLLTLRCSGDGFAPLYVDLLMRRLRLMPCHPQPISALAGGAEA